MARIALKVDVDTLRGTREGVPTLLSMLDAVQAQATFLYSLGPDHTGWALRRVFRPGFLKKVSRTSVVSNYGLRTLMYGVLLPGPDIGRKAAAEMRAARTAGHECGIHTWDHVYWQDNVRQRDPAWTRRQMQNAFDRYVDIFGEAPPTHGAAGWQMNDEAFRQIDDWGMAYASDGRGTAPYIPAVGGVACRHVQMPTTLPTLDEMIGVDGLTEDNVHEAVLRLTEANVGDHVFTLHTELEGGKLAPVFRRLLQGWRAQGHELVSMATYYRHIDRDTLPTLPVTWGSIEGRSGELIIQP
ncbi:4-deoxy-4-formamido-L-arabinose-phosphoundecaprenol deformylase [Cupriavidus pinatubonensis]|uniref:polysaccharide deacetylase family protein n=1 Tax=Cupriavidus pinatubonensis TaxID=248026 RepID=UPI001128A5C8|nr:polysaccharide deacetylase family protein [Cupriavidus pinatubonensis]QYY28924.1 4-deoxy-4-formamido-L-arabinose-phosphoundecaprenol deformylase [Cupriavidus pinatubonensis]TPQ38212.1 4-deoxy-4-formamido-L-arabinose-phosphoundecaprenol deformylase [Cupriavidus pinatubonensis]